MASGTVDLVVVGAGFFGATIAERAAAHGLRVAVIERRNHVGGNAFSALDDVTGIEVHRYGPHVFHTSNARIWGYVHRFTKLNKYVHRVYTTHRGEVFPLPIDLGTINQFFRRALSPDEARALVAREIEAAGIAKARNLEEMAISLIGTSLYQAFVRGYTSKQWGTDPRDLPSSVIARLPVRYNYDSNYFKDRNQGIPIDGYGSWVSRMLEHPNIDVHLGVDFLASSGGLGKSATIGNIPVVYTGALDAYFSYSSGDLRWRTLDFVWDRYETQDFQGVAQMNYADSQPDWTRSVEFKHFHPERPVFRQPVTVVAREFSRIATRDDEPFYPVDLIGDRRRVDQYRALARDEVDIFFGGRLGTYRYLDMHQAIASALALWDRRLAPRFGPGLPRLGTRRSGVG